MNPMIDFVEWFKNIVDGWPLRLFAGLISFLIGLLLFSAAVCHFFQISLAVVLIVSTLVVSWLIIRINDSVYYKIAMTVMVLFAPLLIQIIVAPLVAETAWAKTMFCPDPICKPLAQAESLRQAKLLDAAEFTARECVRSDLSTVCQMDCKVELAFIRSEQSLDFSKSAKCPDALQAVNEAQTLASGVVQAPQTLLSLIKAAQQTWQTSCNVPIPPTPIPPTPIPPTPIPPTPVPPTPVPPTPVPISLELLRGQRIGSQAVVDLRVSSGNTQVKNLPKSAFSVSLSGKVLPVNTFAERSADNPVCVIAVVDVSGSVSHELDGIRKAIDALNAKRKPEDELGLVVFSDPANVKTLKAPTKEALDSKAVITATGGTALWDGILQGIQEANHCSNSLRYLIVVTDGGDNLSTQVEGNDNTQKALRVAEKAALSSIAICAVGVKGTTFEEAPLKTVATGCTYTLITDFDGLYTQFQNIMGYVRDFYRLEFSVNQPVTSPTTVLVRVRDSAEVSVDLDDYGSR